MYCMDQEISGDVLKTSEEFQIFGTEDDWIYNPNPHVPMREFI